MLKDEMQIGVMEADIDSDVDAQAISDTGVRAIQIHTGGVCHLDADMTRQGIRNLAQKILTLWCLRTWEISYALQSLIQEVQKCNDPFRAGGR